MDEADIESHLRKAKYLAAKWGYPEHSDDFAQEAFIAIASGSCPKLEWLFVEFLRKEHGDSRSRCGRIRQRAEKYATRLDAPISEDAGSGLNHDIVRSTDGDPESLLDARRPALPYHMLSGREAAIAMLHYEWGYNQAEIAAFMGITASRVCQILKPASRSLTIWAEHQELREQTLFDKVEIQL